MAVHLSKMAATMIGTRGEGSSCMGVGADVRPAWLPYPGREIYTCISVYFFILEYMNPPKFSDRLAVILCHMKFTENKNQK